MNFCFWFYLHSSRFFVELSIQHFIHVLSSLLLIWGTIENQLEGKRKINGFMNNWIKIFICSFFCRWASEVEIVVVRIFSSISRWKLNFFHDINEVHILTRNHLLFLIVTFTIKGNFTSFKYPHVFLCHILIK